MREVPKLSGSGHQTSIPSTDYQAGYTRLAVSMFARWSTENSFKYMKREYGLDPILVTKIDFIRSCQRRKWLFIGTPPEPREFLAVACKTVTAKCFGQCNIA